MRTMVLDHLRGGAAQRLVLLAMAAVAAAGATAAAAASVGSLHLRGENASIVFAAANGQHPVVILNASVLQGLLDGLSTAVDEVSALRQAGERQDALLRNVSASVAQLNASAREASASESAALQALHGTIASSNGSLTAIDHSVGALVSAIRAAHPRPDVVLLAAGSTHTCAILSNKSAVCWGYNDFGQLGYGHTTWIGDDEFPSVAGTVDVGGPARALACGHQHTCALREDGAILCWGKNGLGQLGYGHMDNIGDNELPVDAGPVDIGGSAAAVVSGKEHVCALRGDHAVVCWGYNNNGQLGYGNVDVIGDDEEVTSAGTVDVGGQVAALAGGRFHTCALLNDSNVVCWGLNGNGQLGYGDTDTIGNDESPSTAGTVDVGGPVLQLVTGAFHTCVLASRSAVEVVCWGVNAAGQLGYGDMDDIGDDEVPADVGGVDVGGLVSSIASFGDHTCATMAGNGSVVCWGLNDHGQLGYGHSDNIGDDEVPASAGLVDIGGPAMQVVVGAKHTCALLESSDVVCWGYSVVGQLGYANASWVGDNEAPSSSSAVDVGGNVSAITAGGFFSCALLASDDLVCFGRGDSGQLGYGTTVNVGDDETPRSAGKVDVGGSVASISVGSYHACALVNSSKVVCWGNPAGYGVTDAVGDNEVPRSAAPIDVGPGPSTAATVSVGDSHTCVLTTVQTVACWGRNAYGEAGYGSAFVVLPTAAGPVSVGGDASSVRAFGSHTCAILLSRALVCWGRNTHGQLGHGHTSHIGDNEFPSSAGAVDVGGPVDTVTGAWAHTAVVLQNGSVVCWGRNAYGELGYGHTSTIGDDELPSSAGVVDVGGPVAVLEVGWFHACAVLNAGSVVCWGWNSQGQLGYGHTATIGDDELPSSAGVVDVGSEVVSVAVGASHTCALQLDKQVICWGQNAFGQLGLATTSMWDVGDNELPVSAGAVQVTRDIV